MSKHDTPPSWFQKGPTLIPAPAEIGNDVQTPADALDELRWTLSECERAIRNYCGAEESSGHNLVSTLSNASSRLSSLSKMLQIELPLQLRTTQTQDRRLRQTWLLSRRPGGIGDSDCRTLLYQRKRDDDSPEKFAAPESLETVLDHVRAWLRYIEECLTERVGHAVRQPAESARAESEPAKLLTN